MKKFKFYLASIIVILILLCFQFFFIVLREATKLEDLKRNWNPNNIQLSDLGFVSDRFIENYNIRKEIVSFKDKKFLIVFIGHDQSYFDRNIVSNMFIYGSDNKGGTVLKDFQSITLNESEKVKFNEILPALPMIEKVTDINNDRNPEFVVNLGEYAGFGTRYTILSYNTDKEDLKWVTLTDANGVGGQSWFFEGYFEDSLLHFEIDENNSSVYQFVGVKPSDIEPDLEEDLNQWQWRADVFVLQPGSNMFLQKIK